ncbi:MAG: preprotein translocase subunit YajC [Terriglobia bacterium]
MTGFILLLGPLILIWYLLIIRPQGRQRHKAQEMLANLKTGDRVVTSGGMIGTVIGFGSSTVQLQIATQVKVEVVRSAITSIHNPDGTTTPARQGEPAAVGEGAKGRKWGPGARS